MATSETEPLWLRRMAAIESAADDVRFPELDESVSQDHEWCEVHLDGRTMRIRFHDYHEVYDIPGLYEAIFYEHLGCCSPSRVIGLLEDVMDDFEDEQMDQLRVLDVGAGNGMVGDELCDRGAEAVYGVDIIAEAREASRRDRPHVYNGYLVTDLTDLPEQEEEYLRSKRLNCLTTVAALGFGDIPAKAFAKALDLISAPGWMAFNIKEAFLHEQDTSGFSRLISQLKREQIIQIQAYRRYRHRFSTAGEPLHYVAVVARKLRELPDHLAGDPEDAQYQSDRG